MMDTTQLLLEAEKILVRLSLGDLLLSNSSQAVYILCSFFLSREVNASTNALKKIAIL